MQNEKLINRAIIAVSLIVPAFVAFLFYSPVLHLDIDVKVLPKLHAVINSCVSILLLSGFVLIRNKKIRAHRAVMLSAFMLSALFLISYVIYHGASESTPYGGEGVVRYLYFLILITHIVLAAVILPLILFTFSKALSGKIEEHKKLAKITFPLWLYVSVTGVLVYLMISPYYI